MAAAPTPAEAADDAVSWREILTRAYAAPLAIVCLGVWLHAADGLLVATMMRAIVSDIGGANLIPWTVFLYEIGSIVAGAASGLLALRYGTRRPMTLAAAVFGIGCAISALAPEMWIMLFGRLLQGLGGGGLSALSIVSIAVMFPKRLLARAVAAVSVIWGVSAFLGPLVGGLFVDLASWRGGFWFFTVQAALLAVWRLTRADTRSPSGTPATAPGGRFPIIRLLWLSAGIIAIAYAGIEVSPLRTPGFILAGLVCLAVFLKLDAAKGAERLLPAAPSLTNPLGAALATTLCFSAATIAIGLYVPFIITALHGLSALVAGYLIAIEAVTWSLAAALNSGAPERRDARNITVGLLIITGSILVLGYSVAFGPVWLIGVGAAIQGWGFGLAWTFILRRATAIAPADQRERVSAAIPTMQRTGYALGAAYLGIIANAFGVERVGEHLATAALAVFAACVPLALLGLIAAAKFVRAKPPS